MKLGTKTPNFGDGYENIVAIELMRRGYEAFFGLISDGYFPDGERREDYLIRLYVVVDWCLEHPEYTAKIKVIPKKDYPVLMPCTF